MMGDSGTSPRCRRTTPGGASWDESPLTLDLGPILSIFSISRILSSESRQHPASVLSRQEV
ncbi:hypothetical protein AQ490_23450 [Wenjunlia vitaminophila]|uniref:Uncharacterized protein n=1 Tax=Wenjunlia vitaminophila TaxID=76728 RepID=A0A0T6LRZ9_WENVI|nr:hypothetical protein AQ490_23450 [Wenjunlia vitaminophila]